MRSVVTRRLFSLSLYMLLLARLWLRIYIIRTGECTFASCSCCSLIMLISVATAPTIVTATLILKPGAYSLHNENPYVTFLLHVYGAAPHESYSFNPGRCKQSFSPADYKGFSKRSHKSWDQRNRPMWKVSSALTANYKSLVS